MRYQCVIGVLMIAVVLSGCAGQSIAAANPVQTSHVEMPPSYRFDPPVIQVRAGTTVTWHNSDHFTHSVKVLDTDLPMLNLRPGESGSLTFDKPGEYNYICLYHTTDMKGKVIVTAP